MADNDALSTLDAIGKQFGGPPPAPVPQQTTQVPTDRPAPTGVSAPLEPAITTQVDPETGRRVPYIGIPAQPLVPRNRTALDSIAGAVDGVESGHKHTDDQGNVKRSPAGALGRMQLEPETARELGVDPYDEQQNLEGGKRRLGNLFDKYGNWDDSLAAYNAGEGRVDKWIAAGRPESGKGALPEKTKAYVPKVLATAGLGDVSPTAIDAAKRRYSMDDLDDLAKGMKVGERGGMDQDHRTTMEVLGDTGRFVGSRVEETDEYLSALYHGAQQGLRDLVAGPVQFGLERTSPQLAQQFTNMLNQYDDQFEGPKKHPWFATAGHVVGTTLGIMAGGEVAGGLRAGELVARVSPQVTRATAALWNRIGLVGRGTAVGSVAGAMEFNRKPEEQSRVIEGVLGGLFGGLTAGVGAAIWRGATRIADTNAFRDFTNTVRDVVGDVTASTSRIRDMFVGQYQRVWGENNARYALRNTEGRTLAPGFPRDEMGNPIAETMAGTRRAGVAPTATTRSVAGQVDRELGGPQARALEAQHQAEVDSHPQRLQEWANRHNNGRIDATPQEEARIRALVDSGQIPPVPEAPGMFEAPPVTPEQFAAARQAIQGARARARDGATRRQLLDMSRNLQAAAERTAEEAGMDVDEYLRSARDADRFYRERIRPMVDAFHVLNPRATAPEQINPSRFWDRVVRLVEGNDMDAVRQFAGMLGRGAEPEMLRVMTYRMFQEMQSGARGVRQAGERPMQAAARRMSEYVHEHAEAIRTLGGRDLERDLLGMANIADRLAQNPERYAALFHALTSHRWMQALGVAEIGMGILERSGRRTMIGMGMAVAPWAGHVLYQVLTRAARLPGLLPLIRRAERTRPDSAEMDRLMAEFQRRVLVSAAVGARTVAPAGKPLAPVPGALGQAGRQAIQYSIGR